MDELKTLYRYLLNEANASDNVQTAKAVRSFTKAVGEKNLDTLSLEAALQKWFETHIYRDNLKPSSLSRYIIDIKGLYCRLCSVGVLKYRDIFDGLQSELTILKEAEKKNSDKSPKADPIDPKSKVKKVNALSVCQNLQSAYSTLENEDRKILDILFFALFDQGQTFGNVLNRSKDDFDKSIPQLADIATRNDLFPNQQYVFTVAVLNQRRSSPNIAKTYCERLSSLLECEIFDNRTYAGNVADIPAEAWIEAAMAVGLTDAEIRAITKIVPAHYAYLNRVEPATDDAQAKRSILRVANSIREYSERWYVVRLIRNTVTARNTKKSQPASKELKRKMWYSHSANQVAGIVRAENAYYPYTMVMVEDRNHRKRKASEPVIAEYMFVKSNANDVAKLSTQISSYGKLVRQRGGKRPFSSIPTSQMRVFMTEFGDEKKYLAKESVDTERYEVGDIVTIKRLGNLQFKVTKVKEKVSGESRQVLELEILSSSKSPIKAIETQSENVTKC